VEGYLERSVPQPGFGPRNPAEGQLAILQVPDVQRIARPSRPHAPSPEELAAHREAVLEHPVPLVAVTEAIAKVSLVGVGMRSHSGVASRMFDVLAREQINIMMISTSEIKISAVIDEKYLELAMRSLHAAFGLDQA
jgi:aspartokinase